MKKTGTSKIIANEHGGALFLAMFASVLVCTLGLTAYYVANTELTESSKKYEMSKALYLAEGGLERAILELEGGLGNGWDDEVAGSDGEAGTEDDGILSFGGEVECYSYGTGDDYQGEGVGFWNSYLGHYDVKILDGRRPGESPEKCNRVIIGSDGISTKNFKRRVEAEVELWELHLPKCFVYIDGSNMDTKFDGNTFLLDGKDTNPDGSPGPEADVPAILVPSWVDANNIKGEVASNQCDQVLGLGNPGGGAPKKDKGGDDPACTPSVYDLGSWNPNSFNPAKFKAKDLPKLESMVNNVVAGGTMAGHTTIGAPDNYLITKCTGDLHTSGQFEGYGVLIIEGDWVNTGKGRWDGLVIVKNECRMSGGGNGFHIYGMCLIMNGDGDDGDEEFRFSGSADGSYSTQTITNIQLMVRTLTVNSWRQTSGL